MHIFIVKVVEGIHFKVNIVTLAQEDATDEYFHTWEQIPKIGQKKYNKFVTVG